MIENLLQDVRFAARGFRKRPGFAVVCILTLALAIGANTAIFTVIDAVLLRPVPGVANPSEIVTLERLQKNNPDFAFGYPDYLDYVSQSHTFSGLAGRCRARVTLSHAGGAPELLIGELVSGNYFSVLGVQPALGRVIAPTDAQTEGQAPVAVLSHGLWQRSFGSDPQITGKVVEINGHAFTVIGVADRSFNGSVIGSPTDLWVPLTMQPDAIPRMSHGILASRNAGWVGIFGRIKTGVRLSEARSDLQLMAAHLAAAYPQSNEHRSVDVIASFGMDPDDRAALARFLALLLASVGLLLLIGCSNVASLLLSRADSRRREMAMRLALGATPGRLLQQLLTEGVLLALLAGVLGLLLAPWTAQLIVTFRQPLYAMHNLDTRPDLQVLGFTIAIALLTGVAFALAPALQAGRAELVTGVKENASSSGRRSRLKAVFVATQMAISLVLLVTAGTTIRKMREIVAANPGFGVKNIALMTIAPNIQGYSEAQGQRFYEKVLQRVGATPGVESASLATTVPPIDFSTRISIFYEGQAPSPEYLAGHEFEAGVRVDLNNVAPNYFRTMSIPLLQGRDFSVRDQAGTPLVGIVTQKLAQRLWPRENAVGKRVEWPAVNGEGARAPIEIVGVVADAKYRSLIADAPLLLYLPALQNYAATQNLVFRAAADPNAVLPAIRDAIASIDPNMRPYGEKTITDQIANSLWQQRMAAGLLGSFSFLALVLAAIGLYAVVAHWAGQRTQEIGVRMALGARRGDVLRLILGHGAAMAAIGIVVGGAAALEAMRLVSGLLFGFRDTDFATVLATAALLALIALLASYIPARRAMRVDPVIALRHE